ncbi:MAG: glycosyltransferase [Tannerellaceae bacterium]|jgi:glycosyltransferase involved in cell wall biosynthesis|nr:glycosyltransferase [Tannerellaceae bacterium]
MTNFDLQTISIEQWIMLGACLGFAIIQLLYLIVVYMRPIRRSRADATSQASSEQLPPVSVIVYSKNESHKLEQNLPSILQQEYPQYEVIVINDGSTDETDLYLTLLKQQYPNLYHTFIPQESKYLSRRKLSLTLGIKAAQYDILLFTEAGCRPMSPHWIASMAQRYADGPSIVLGFSAYIARKGLLDRIAAFDNLIHGAQYISSALAGKAFCGSGRNLSYRKEHFHSNKGFSHSLNLHAGDDDLFINRTATRSNTRVEYSPNSITEAGPIEYFDAWKDIKVSRAATKHHYRGLQKLFYRLEAATSILFLASFAVTLATAYRVSSLPLAIASAGLYIILYTSKILVWRKLALLLRQRPLALSLPFLEIFRHTFDLYVLIYRKFRGKEDYTNTVGGKNG